MAYASFDEFWQSISAPAGPAGRALAELSPDALAQLRARLQERTTGADGRVVYEACANAIKGRKRRG